MAHALHPNYPDKHEEYHRPELQKGLVIKHNANQRYATSAVTAFLFKEIARIHNLPVQVFFDFFAFKEQLEHSFWWLSEANDNPFAYSLFNYEI